MCARRAHALTELSEGSTTAPGRRRSPDVRAVITAVACLALLAPGSSPVVEAVAASGTGRPIGVKGTCDPQVLVLPALTSDGRAWVRALSDSGLAVGVAWADDDPLTAVVWTDPTHVVSTGIGGTRENGRMTTADAVDVNESGLVAINRYTYERRVVAVDAVIWSATAGATVLPAPAARPRATLTAINDAGDVVGEVYGNGNGHVPVIWRDGRRSRLPTPPKISASPADINNEGLVVGSFHNSKKDVFGAWYWDLAGTDRGPLPKTTGGRTPWATDVDNAGRVFGTHNVGPGDSMRTMLWRHVAARPRPLLHLSPGDVHDSGYIAATDPGFRGFGASAFVGHRRDNGVAARLAAPPYDGGAIEWNNVVAQAVARGVSPFAPHGGVTVGGYAQDYDLINQPVLWTCAQTLL